MNQARLGRPCHPAAAGITRHEVALGRIADLAHDHIRRRLGQLSDGDAAGIGLGAYEIGLDAGEKGNDECGEKHQKTQDNHQCDTPLCGA